MKSIKDLLLVILSGVILFIAIQGQIRLALVEMKEKEEEIEKLITFSDLTLMDILRLANSSWFLKENPEYITTIRETENHHIVTVTVYNPTIEQCDSDPYTTADGSHIDTVKLKKGKINWCAVSRDLREKYPYGSEIIVYIGNEPQIFEVHDTMSEKFSNRIDLLRPVEIKEGKWENILITSDKTVLREI